MLSFLFLTLFVYNNSVLNIEYEYNSRIISTIHSIVILIVSVLGLTYSDDYSNVIIYCSTSYLAIDLITQYFFVGIDKENIFHHIIMFILVHYGTKFQYLSLLYCGLLCEITNPLLHLSFYYYKKKKTSSIIFIYSSKLLVVTYFLFRILNFTILTFYSWNINIFVFIIIFSLTVLNYYWFYKILKIALK